MGSLLDSPTVGLLLIVVVVVPIVLIVWVLVRASRGHRPAPESSRAVDPGWYAQPDGSSRWWDGIGWTDDVRRPEPPDHV
jgi:hypothetical protein